MLKKSASIVLAALRDSTYRSVRLASSLAAALLNGLFEHPETILTSPPSRRFHGRLCINRVFPQLARRGTRRAGTSKLSHRSARQIARDNCAILRSAMTRDGRIRDYGTVEPIRTWRAGERGDRPLRLSPEHDIWLVQGRARPRQRPQALNVIKKMG